MIEFEHIRPAHRDREPLLTKEQIWAIDDVSALHDIRDSVMERCKAIEVDLEFRTDDGADEDWEHRARTALTYHKICETHLTKRIKFLTGQRNAQNPVTEREKQEAKLRGAELQLKQQEAAAAKEREKTLRQMISQIEAGSFHAAFYAIVRAYVDHETFLGFVQQAKDEAGQRWNEPAAERAA